ncbi:MAG: transposase [Bacteroidota bacterium]
MEHYCKSSQTVYDSKYHLVWITKNRKRALQGKIATRARELIKLILNCSLCNRSIHRFEQMQGQ